MSDTDENVPTVETALPNGADDAPAGPGVRRWAAVTGLDLFWPALAVVLAIAVVFVASVAHNSMDSVGAVGSTGVPLPKPAPSPSAVVSTTTLTIVQVSSHPGRVAALAAAQRVADRGLVVHVLDSSKYQPMNPGYFVVYSGPYPTTPQGRAEAKRIQVQLPGSIIREIQPRTP